MIDDIKGIAIILVIICIGLISYMSGEDRTEEEIGAAFSLLKLLTISSGIVIFVGIVMDIILK
jgi:hypothetical protein|nr:MAG TPA: hypothetical protein [Caudoviricetes sp.]